MTGRRKPLNKLVVGVIIIILLCVLALASKPITYSLFMDQVDRYPSGGDFYPEDYYKIDTSSILLALDAGSTDVFSPTTEIPEDYWPDNAHYFQWHQSDYFKIAKTINLFEGKDFIDDWNIYSVDFGSKCDNTGDGFSTGHIILYRPVMIQYELHYEAREIFIDPMIGIVRWGDSQVYPRPVFGWSKINLNKFKITAEQAFQIAEENGGKQGRVDWGNTCNISAIGRPYYWLVLYSGFGDRLHSMKYYVNGYTGKIISTEKY